MRAVALPAHADLAPLYGYATGGIATGCGALGALWCIAFAVPFSTATLKAHRRPSERMFQM